MCCLVVFRSFSFFTLYSQPFLPANARQVRIYCLCRILCMFDHDSSAHLLQCSIWQVRIYCIYRIFCTFAHGWSARILHVHSWFKCTFCCNAASGKCAIIAYIAYSTHSHMLQLQVHRRCRTSIMRTNWNVAGSGKCDLVYIYIYNSQTTNQASQPASLRNGSPKMDRLKDRLKMGRLKDRLKMTA